LTFKGYFPFFFGTVSISKEDSILTFNYDLVLERAFWKLGRWTPNEGYIGVSDFDVPEDKGKLNQSSIRLLKLHGSLNWLPPKILPPKENLRITLDNLECWGFFFENMEEMLKRRPKSPSGAATKEISKGYAGGIFRYWVLPSYVKRFDRDIWKEASKIFQGTTHLIVIGYSFPKEDCHTKSLFESSLSKKREITVIDPNWEAIKFKLSDLGFNRVKGITCLEEWLGE
jgi:hypothetical protein